MIKKDKIVMVKRETKCRFCRNRVNKVDYKDVGTLHKLTTAQGKMFSSVCLVSYALCPPLLTHHSSPHMLLGSPPAIFLPSS